MRSNSTKSGRTLRYIVCLAAVVTEIGFETVVTQDDPDHFTNASSSSTTSILVFNRFLPALMAYQLPSKAYRTPHQILFYIGDSLNRVKMLRVVGQAWLESVVATG